ncbi:hypothetical protein H8705_00925 [Oscillospiraceae bacterium NSJ-64]|uniref:ABC-transporter type IV n=1 Tax=Youxingia wuxianensis TaxID=2763678 RepID=A0A926IGE0_9FIRM|nr:hypothetical protein [Youxingia wuxianensis]
MPVEKIKEYATVYTIGSVGYSMIEILWRGFTHWTMALTGGVCFLFIHIANFRLTGVNIWKKCLAGSTIITLIEFVVGCIVNRLLHMNVWDYSKQFLNIMGQVCPLYSILWFFLCIPTFGLSRFIKQKMFPKN